MRYGDGRDAQTGTPDTGRATSRLPWALVLALALVAALALPGCSAISNLLPGGGDDAGDEEIEEDARDDADEAEDAFERERRRDREDDEDERDSDRERDRDRDHVELDEEYEGNGVTLRYPSDWERYDDESGVTYIYMPSGGMLMVNTPWDLGANVDDVPASEIDGFFEEYVTGFESSGTATILDSQRIDGDGTYVMASQIEADYGDMYQGYAWVCLAGSDCYSVMVMDVEDNYDDSEAVMQEVMDSIELA